MSTVDFHVHAFPDSLADRATARVEQAAGVRARRAGTITSLLAAMDEAGIETSVVLSIATRPSQFEPILKWSQAIRCPRIVPFLSVHPADPQAAERVRLAASMGFKGFKFQPYYQEFSLDEERMFPIYEALQEAGLICVSHTGFDTAHPFERVADPPRILTVLERFPDLTFVATHLGAWQDWDLVAELLPKARLWTDISYTLPFLPAEKARSLIAAFPADRLLFGSDWPWADQSAAIRSLGELGLDPLLEEAILGGNARKLLGG
jgi:predicted TIM-barrel fold metal-dependent hydrolase